MSGTPRITLRPHSDTITKQARDARARAWAYVFECWHAKKGDPHDLTNEMVSRAEAVSEDKKGQDRHVRR
jgi:hypothetical protein